MIKKFIRIWKDAVFSKVISVGILGLLSLVYNFINSKVENTTFRDELTKFWTIRIQLWHIVVLSVLVSVAYLFIKKYCKFKYDDGSLKLDQELFLEIREKHLTEEMMLVPKNNGFSSNPFLAESLHKILNVCEESKKSSFEFINPVLEKKKNELIRIVYGLGDETSKYIFGTNNSGWLSIPREWVYDDRVRFDEAWQSILKQENLLTEKYDSFIKTGRRMLKV